MRPPRRKLVVVSRQDGNLRVMTDADLPPVAPNGPEAAECGNPANLPEASAGGTARLATSSVRDGVSDEQVRDAAFGGARWLGLTQGVIQILTLAAGVILARLITPGDFGRLAVAVIASEFALMLAHETLATPLVQRSELEPEHLEAATLLGLLLGGGLALVMLFAIPLITTPIFGARTTELFQMLSVQFAIAGVMIVPFARLQRDLRFRRIGLTEAATAVVSATASVNLAALGLGAKAYVLGMLCGSAVMAAGFATGGGLVLPRWRPRHMRELLGFGTPASAAGFAQIAYRNVDYMILGARVSAVTVGFYYRAFTVGVEYERRLSAIVARIAFPVYTRTQDPARRLALRLRIVRTNVVLVYPMLALFIALAPRLMPWLFGVRWTSAVLPAQILAVAGMASCVRNLHSPTVLAAGRPRAMFAFSLAEMLLYAAAVWLAAPHGLIFICVMVSSFQVVSLVLAYTVLLRHAAGIAPTQIFVDLGPAVLASLPLMGVAIAVRHAFAADLPVPVLLLLAGSAGGAVYLAALRLVSPDAWNDVMVLARRLAPRISARRVASAMIRRRQPSDGLAPHVTRLAEHLD